LSRDAGVPRTSLEILSIVGAAALVVAAGRAVAGSSASLALPGLLDAGCFLLLAGPFIAWRVRVSVRRARRRGAASDELFNTTFRGQAEAELAASLVVTSSLARAVDVREAAAAVNEALVRRTGLDRTSVLLYQEDGVCRFVGWNGLSAEYRRAVEGHCPWKEGTPDAEPIVVDDVEKDPTLDPYLELFEREDIATLAFVPILARGGVVGKLMLYGREPGSITGAAVRKAHLVAVSLGTAVARLRMADALARSESRLRAMIDNALDAVVSMDVRGIVTAWNGQAETIFGWTVEEAIGRPLHELIIPEELREEHCRGLAHYAKTGEGPALGKRLEMPAVRKDGSRMSVELSITPLQSGEEVLFSGFMRDITESERAADELIEARAAAEAANRAKSEFLANMSHEIRTPLTSILGYADLLRESGEHERAPGRRQQTIDTIQAAGQHLLTVINDILDISKIEAGKMTVEAVETPLIEILQTIGELLRPRAAEKGVAFEIRLESPLPERIVSDPTRLRQILVNLAGNATKFTSSGSVAIVARAEIVALGPQRLTIDVEDTGPGISQVQAARLFRPFGQADASMTRRHGGTGLGLTISHRLARLLGGSVSILRTELGRGSCFRLELPLVPAPGAAWVGDLQGTRSRASQAVETLPRLPGRILLAEDGRDNQFLIAFHLRKAGAEVEVAHNGRLALETLEREAAAGRPFDLLLTDIQMPEMDGYTLTCMLRQRGNRIPIVALTAHAMLEDRQRCFDAGCDDYVGKPIDKARLVTTCARWLGSKRASEERAA
jgi:PAS domain S-box-containing protein